MGAVGGQGQAALAMTDAALDDGSVVALKLSGRNVVVGSRIVIGPYGVGAAVTDFTGNTAMAFAESEKGVGIFRKPFVGCQEGRSGSVAGSVVWRRRKGQFASTTRPAP